jgi:F-type H+-transporting ATPase subunit gamma
MRAIEQTLQVTSAMNLISTSKLRRGRRILEDTEPFFLRVQKAMLDIYAGAGSFDSRFLEQGKESEKKRRTAVLVVTSDKGLAGGYNASVFREVVELCRSIGEEKKSPVLILIGAIGYRYFVHSPYVILENFSFQSKLPVMDNAQEISDFVISQYLWGMFDEVRIVYTHMYSSVKLLPVARQIIPLDAKKMQDALSRSGGDKRVELQFEYLPSKEEVFDALVPLYVKGIIYGCLVESYASEQSARMSAMEEASKSAGDILESLRLSYNHARQAGITQEITEIVSGSSALG